MSEYGSLAKKIAKGKLPYENWNQFSVRYRKDANRLSGVQLSLNLVSLLYSEEIWQEDGLCALGEEFLEIVKQAVHTGFSAEELKDSVLSYRNQMKERMDCLMAYVDRFMVYQYVWNCLRYQFEEYDYPDYDDDSFTEQLLHFITKDKDQANIKMKMMEVLKKLPIRFTRSRFFEMVKDGFSAYIGSDKSTLDDFIYMLRTSALLYEPAHMEEFFPDLYEYAERFAGTDYRELTQEEYYKQDLTMMECVAFLQKMLSSCQLFSETVNQLYAYILTADYAGEESEADKAVREILRHTLNTFRPDVPYELDGHLTELLTCLEGEQEAVLDELSEADGHLEDIGQTAFFAQASEPIMQEYDLLFSLSRLLSSSYFADLEPQKEEEAVSEAYASQTFGAFRQELEPMLKTMPKLTGRAIMAAVIGYLPINFSNTEDLRRHIRNSLSACTNLPEKMALVDCLEEIMNEEEYD